MTLRERLSVGALRRAQRRLAAPQSARVNLDALLEDVLRQRYRPSRPWIRRIRKPTGGMRRLVVPAPRDRLLQRAVLDVVPARVRRVRGQVHGYVRGRSAATAVSSLLGSVGRRGWVELVQIDVANLFDTLDHRRLAEAVVARWSDPTFEWLCMTWARAYGRNGRGVGQGAPLSPLLANLFLGHFVDPVVDMVADVAWVRYGDDITAVTEREGGALWLYAGIELACIAAGLEVSMRKVVVSTSASADPVRVLGHTLALEDRGGWGLRCISAPRVVAPWAGPRSPSLRRGPS